MSAPRKGVRDLLFASLGPITDVTPHNEASNAAERFVLACAECEIDPAAIHGSLVGWSVGRGVSAISDRFAKETVRRLVPAKPDAMLEMFEAIEPWPEPVAFADVLTEIENALHRYVHIKAEDAVALSLWAAQTWFVDASSIAPRILLRSPDKRCGKTRVFQVLRWIVRRPIVASSYTAASLFRLLDAAHPTLLLDEADRKAFDDDGVIVQVLNSGFCRDDAQVLRCDGEGNVPRVFDCYGPIAFASIGSTLPDTVIDRSLVIEMERLPPGQTVERFRSETAKLELLPLRRKLLRLTEDRLEGIRTSDPEVPDQLNDRAQEAVRPLIAIADAAGGDYWPTIGRKAVTMIYERQDEEPASWRTGFLAAVRDIFEASTEKSLPTALILEQLRVGDDGRMRSWNRGHGVDDRDLASLFKNFGVRPTSIRFGAKTLKGYERADVQRVFENYLPPRPRAEQRNIGANGGCDA